MPSTSFRSFSLLETSRLACGQVKLRLAGVCYSWWSYSVLSTSSLWDRLRDFVKVSVWQVRLLWLSNPMTTMLLLSVSVAHLSMRKCWDLQDLARSLDDGTFMVWLASTHRSWPGLELRIPRATPHSTPLVKYVEEGAHITLNPLLFSGLKLCLLCNAVWVEIMRFSVSAEKQNNLTRKFPPEKPLPTLIPSSSSTPGWWSAEIKPSVECVCNGTEDGCYETNP